MIRILTALSILLTMLPTMPAQTLATLADKSRVLLVFAPADQDPRYGEQLTLLSHHVTDLKDRDLVLLPILSQPGPPATADILRALQPPPISDEEQLTLRHRFRIAAADFTVILLGKDGGEKLRSSIPISSDRLNRTIDAMPMRRQEIRERTPTL